MSSKAKKSSKKTKNIIFLSASKLPYHYGMVMRIYPSCEQKRIIQHNIDASNAVYNKFVKAGRCRLPKTNGNFPVFETINQRAFETIQPTCKILKAQFHWLNNDDLDSLMFVNVERTYQAAWNLCRKVKQVKPPQFRKKKTHQSYQTNCMYNGKRLQQEKQRPNLSNGSVRLFFENGKHRIMLPKLGTVTCRLSKSMLKKLHRMERKGILRIGTVTIAKLPDGSYTCSLQLASDAPFVNKLPKTGCTVGVDLNLSNFLTDSNGNVVENPRHYKKAQERLRQEQSRLGKKLSKAKQRLGIKQTDKIPANILARQKNYQRQRELVAILHVKVRNQRKDFLDKLSMMYIKNHDVIVAEELRSRNLVKNHALASAISDAGWRLFLSMLEYKAKMYGKTFITVNPKNTTQTCNVCGHVMEGKDKIRLGVEEWTCPVCHSHHSRDWNAAKNIHKKGLAFLHNGGKAPL
jgi:putative transposase